MPIMLKVRFYTNADDYRPIKWPVKHPYWCTGYGGSGFDDDERAVLVSYADDLEYIYEHWPEAQVDFVQVRHEYTFTDRFPKPDWFDVPGAQE